MNRSRLGRTLLLVVVTGAILAFAVTVDAEGFNLNTIAVTESGAPSPVPASAA